ncbi:MAG TPA: dihydroorotase family protein [Geobacterales bacterium]|nr:dihydroorotase family protein [Geobacterales bacterium]
MSKVNNEFQLIGRAFIENTIIDCSILIEGEKIKKVSKLEQTNVKTIRFSDQFLIIPSAIDLHVHFRDWGQSHKENIKSASMAALAGGVTTALDMPNTIPPINSLELIKKRIEDFKNKSLIDYGIHSKPVKVEELREARKYIFGFKFYEEDLSIIPEYISNVKHDRLVFHAQFGQDEQSAVKFVLDHTFNCENIRFAHISRKASLDLINSSRLEGRKIFVEATPHHVFLSMKDLERKPTGYSTVRPPLAEREDNIALIEAINTGKVDFIATDHAPHSFEEKLSENPPPGYPSLEIYVSLFLTFSKRGLFNLVKVMECLCSNPARYLGIRKGEIREDYYADLTVVDVRSSYIVDSSKFVSLSKFSPFEGWELSFKPVMTILRGNVMYLNGDFQDKNHKPKQIAELG